MDQQSANSNRPVFWFEVEALIRHFDSAYHPSGTHRVSIELLTAAKELKCSNIRFCRLSSFTGRLHSIGFETIQKACLQDHAASYRAVDQSATLSAVVATMLRICRLLSRRFTSWLRDLWRPAGSEFKRGDCVIVIGSAWDDRRYVKHMRSALARYDLRLSVLIHDIIPLTFPEFVMKPRIAQFRDWFCGMLPLAEQLLTSSEHCRSQIREWCNLQGYSTPPINLVRFGDGFSHVLSDRRPELDFLPDYFVLFVSTIEIRKNHRLLLRLWERLMETYPISRVPHLVWVGDRGWLVNDLFDELDAKNYLNGRVVILSDLSDAELQTVYERCAFTIYPSWCEGWGLPIRESFNFGKLCVSSNRTSLPEVGRAFADYFDPANEDEAFRSVERALFEPGYVDRRNRFIEREFQPTTWQECIRLMLRLVQWADQKSST